MADNPQALALLEIAKALDTKKSIEDFVHSFEVVLEVFAALSADNAEERGVIKAQLLAGLKKIDDKLATVKDGYTPRKGIDYNDGAPGYTPRKGIDYNDGEKGDKGDDGEDADPKAVLDLVEKRLPELGEAVRDALELLRPGSRLHADYIDGLEAIIKKYAPTASPSRLIAAQVNAVRIQRFHDLSDSLDGVTKTFSLPAFTKVHAVLGSSFPGVLRKTTDFTTDPATMQITFTSQIDAATTLASGQTVIVVLSEA